MKTPAFLQTILMRPVCPGGMSPGFAAISVPDWTLSGVIVRRRSNGS